MVSCPSSMVSAVCVVPFPPHAGGFLTLSISTTTASSVRRWGVAKSATSWLAPMGGLATV